MSARSHELDGWFGISRASWLTLPRVLVEDMPLEWQERLAGLLKEYDARFPRLPETGLDIVVSVKRNGQYVAMPDWLGNYRRPDHHALAQLRHEPDGGAV